MASTLCVCGEIRAALTRLCEAEVEDVEHAGELAEYDGFGSRVPLPHSLQLLTHCLHLHHTF